MASPTAGSGASGPFRISITDTSAAAGTQPTVIVTKAPLRPPRPSAPEENCCIAFLRKLCCNFCKAKPTKPAKPTMRAQMQAAARKKANPNTALTEEELTKKAIGDVSDASSTPHLGPRISVDKSTVDNKA